MIEAKQLTKKFGTTVALNGITFRPCGKQWSRKIHISSDGGGRL